MPILVVFFHRKPPEQQRWIQQASENVEQVRHHRLNGIEKQRFVSGGEAQFFASSGLESKPRAQGTTLCHFVEFVHRQLKRVHHRWLKLFEELETCSRCQVQSSKRKNPFTRVVTSPVKVLNVCEVMRAFLLTLGLKWEISPKL